MNKYAGIAFVAVIILGFAWYSLKAYYLPIPFLSPVDSVSTLSAKSSASDLVAQVIKKFNIDKKHGLDLTITSAVPGDLERRYFSGEFPIMNIGVVTAAEGYKKGVPSTIIGPVLPMTYDVVVRNESSIHNLRDLKGKVLGILPKATAAYPAVATVLESAGLDPEKDLKLSFGTAPEIANSLLRGDIDAAIVAYPIAAPVFATGKVRSIADLEGVWEEHENGLPLPLAITAVRDDWYATHKRVAQKFVATWQDASEMLIHDPTIVEQFPDYLTSIGATSSSSVRLVEQNLPRVLMADWDDNARQGVLRLYSVSQQFGFADKNSPAPSVK
jgi:ABC-type taurine transport system substrate-binding protein